MTVRPPHGFELPELVSVANRVLTDEAAGLTAALDRFWRLPRPFCASEQDDRAWSSIVTTRGEVGLGPPLYPASGGANLRQCL